MAKEERGQEIDTDRGATWQRVEKQHFSAIDKSDVVDYSSVKNACNADAKKAGTALINAKVSNI
jgi:hypothetical protein